MLGSDEVKLKQGENEREIYEDDFFDAVENTKDLITTVRENNSAKLPDNVSFEYWGVGGFSQRRV